MLCYGFFDSEIIGYDDEGMPLFDRAESSDFLAMFISQIISDGVLALPGDSFQVIASSGMTLKVRPGFGIIRGRFAVDKQEYEIQIPNAPSSYKRIDRVVLRANYLQRLCEIVVKEGTPAANPEPPELLRPASGDYYELCLATVTVNSNQTVISQTHITDTRYDSQVCGVVTQVIDHLDTSEFHIQLQQFFNEYVDRANSDYNLFMNNSISVFQEWFDGVKEILEATENGNMLSRIQALIDDMYNMADENDIDNILLGSYVDIDNEGSIFETGTNQDVDEIIGGSYVDQEEGNQTV